MAIDDHTFRRIECAVELMGARIGEDRIASLDELSAAAGLSKFHFHRIYRLVTGETCGQTQTRLRMARGAGALRSAGATVTDAALDAGFSSSQAFAKALKKHLNRTPSQLRREPDRLALVVDRLVRIDAPVRPLSVEIVSFDPFEIVAIRTRGLYPDVADTFGRLYEGLGGPGQILAIIGVAHGDLEAGAETGLVFDCGFRTNRTNAPVPDAQTVTIEGGTYLRARHVGAYSRLSETVDPLYRLVLANPEAQFADRPCVFHYVDDPAEVDEAALRTDVHVPVTSFGPIHGDEG